MTGETVHVSYLELTVPPAPVPDPAGEERIAVERLSVEAYLTLYREVGAPWRWDQRLRMPRAALERLLQSPVSQIYVLRDAGGEALGFCELERHPPEVELKNFGLLTSAQGRGLGPWLLWTALQAEWARHPRRIWLHTDNWDHPAAIRVYEKAGLPGLGGARRASRGSVRFCRPRRAWGGLVAGAGAG